MQVEHPAAKIIILASQMQEQEVGDGTNFIIILAGALLQEAEDLLRMVTRIDFYLTSSRFASRRTRILFCEYDGNN